MDNLLTVHRRIDGIDARPERSNDDGFYGEPVVLEEEPDMRYLGLCLDVTGPLVEAQLQVHDFASIAHDLDHFVSNTFASFDEERWH